MRHDLRAPNWGSGAPHQELMRFVFEELARGRNRPLLDAVHDDVIWKLATTRKGYFPFGGEYRGRAGVEQSLAQFSKRFAFRRFEPVEIVSAGEIVWGVFSVLIESIEDPAPNPKSVTTQIAIRWRISDNRVLEHQAFTDTLSLLFPAG